jgi:acyl-CoA dehydrogenase/citronellyl-CoA dehydrogenase
VTVGATGEARTKSAFELDQEHAEFQEVCRSFVSRRVLPLVSAAEESGTFPSELWSELGRNGFLGIGYPEQLGGSDGDYLSLAIFSEEIAKSSGGIAVAPLVSAYMAAPHLLHFGTPEQQERYLRPVLSGTMVAAIAVTEPGAGSDVAGISTTALVTDGGYRLRGTKMFITNGGFADFVIVAAKTDVKARRQGMTMLIVESGDAGFSVGRPLKKMGWHSSDTRELVFDDCFVPADRVVGAVGRGFYQIMAAFQTERLTLAGMGVGLAQACLDDAVGYAVERTAFGKPIGSFQAIRHALAEMMTEVEAARLLTYKAAALIDSGSDFTDAVAMAKLFAARAACNVADKAVQVFGGYGYLDETRVSMHFRDARILRIGGGTDEVQMEILAKCMGL